jgi:type IV pilus assembly protein PilQ
MRRIWTLIAATVIALGASATAALAASAGEPGSGVVTSVSVIPADGNAEVVIVVQGAVMVTDFTLSSPYRLVLDVAGARLDGAPRAYDRMRRGAITNVRMAQYRDDVVRVVLELAQPRRYTVAHEDGAIRITVDGGGAFTAWHTSPRGETVVASAGRLEAPPATPARPAVASTQSRTVMAAPERQSINTRTPAPAAAVSPQPRITVVYHDADVRDVLAAFAVFSQRTIIAGKGVSGAVTAEVRDQPWDIALRAILSSQGLAAREDADGIISVDSYENISKQQSAEPLVTQIIPVNYARAARLVETAKSLLSKDCGVSGDERTSQGCVVRGSVVADSSTNRLIVTDAPSRIQDIISHLRELDVRIPQVAIKAKIIFVNRTNIEDIGVAYDLGSSTQFFNRLVARQDPSTFQPIDSDGDGVPDGVGGGTPFDRNLNVIHLGGNALSSIANANSRVVNPALELIFSTALGRFNLTTFIDALQEVRLADIQAEPSITTLDNNKAEILVGEETPIRVIDMGAQGQGGGQQQAPRATVEFKETGIILSVTPQVTNNRQILMTLHAERSNLVPAAADLGFTFQKQRATNQLLVNDGETAVIGGLTVTQVTVSKVGIPILVDLPFVGRLFGQTRREEAKRDLLILVTPHIIDEGEKLGAPAPGR